MRFRDQLLLSITKGAAFGVVAAVAAFVCALIGFHAGWISCK